jgi:hypothetical protein
MPNVFMVKNWFKKTPEHFRFTAESNQGAKTARGRSVNLAIVSANNHYMLALDQKLLIDSER